MFSTIALSLTLLFASSAAANALQKNKVLNCYYNNTYYSPGEKKIRYTSDGLYCITQECENGRMKARRTQLSECEVKTCQIGEILTRRDGECCSYCKSLCDPACPDNSTCSNDSSCLCDPGFYEKNSVCVDVNECLDTTLSDCGSGTKCVNTVGNYTCDCLEGYDRINFSQCSLRSGVKLQQRIGNGDRYYYYYYYYDTEIKKQLLQGAITSGIGLLIFVCILFTTFVVFKIWRKH